MSFLVSIVRRRFLCLQKSAAEWRLQLITQAMARAQNACNDLLQVGTDYSADSTIGKRLLARQNKMKALEDRLALQKAALERQIEECKQELESCKGMISEGIQQFFSYGKG